MASDLLRKQRYLGGHPNVTEYEEGPFSVIEASPTEDFKRSREDVAQVRASPQGRWWTAPTYTRRSVRGQLRSLSLGGSLGLLPGLARLARGVSLP